MADGFPYNVVDQTMLALADALPPMENAKGVMQDAVILDRPLRPSDPSRTFGVIALDWKPVPNTVEMGRRTSEPTLQRYNYRIQGFTRHGDESIGRRTSAYDAKVIRSVLYRDASLGVALRSLSDAVLGTTEIAKRYGVASQRYLNNQVAGGYVWWSSTEFWVETETIDS